MIIINFLDRFEQIEKEQGMLGALVGLLIIAVATMTTLIGIAILVKFNLSVLNWVVEYFWFK